MQRSTIRASFIAAATIASMLGSSFVGCVGDEPSSGDGTTDGAAAADGSTGSDGSPGDASTGDGATPPAQGFTMSLSPSHVVGDPGDAPVITINLLRAIGFTDAISFTITPPPGLTPSAAATTSTGGTSSSFTLTFEGSVALGDPTLTVNGANHDSSFVQDVSLGIHVGSLVDTSDGGLLIPGYASSIIVDAWGAGGGSAFDLSGVASLGGGGGYASQTISVTPGQFFLVRAGTGGAGDTADGFGAAGGGYSSVCPASGACLIIAGAGGGGASGQSGHVGGNGGPGGGSTGGSSSAGNGDSCGVSTGGSQTAGGTTPGCTVRGDAGVSLQGGKGGGNPETTGGVPGGGAGTESACGGGGGGYFGGAGGDWDDGTDGANGGGGGSGYVGAGGTLTPGSGASPGGSVALNCPAGTGVGSSDGGNGGPGCVVVHLAKP